MRSTWSKGEEKYLRRYYPFEGAQKCAHFLKRSEASIYGKVSDMGLYRRYDRPAEVEEEPSTLSCIDYIYEGCEWPPMRVTDPRTGFYNLAFEIFNFGRTLSQARENAWTSEFRIEWNEEEVQQLIDLAPNYAWTEIGEELGVTPHSARHKYHTLVEQGKAPFICKNRKWSDEEVAFLIANYNAEYAILSAKLNKSPMAIGWKIRKLRLPRDGYTIEEE